MTHLIELFSTDLGSRAFLTGRGIDNRTALGQILNWVMIGGWSEHVAFAHIDCSDPVE